MCVRANGFANLPPSLSIIHRAGCWAVSISEWARHSQLCYAGAGWQDMAEIKESINHRADNSCVGPARAWRQAWPTARC
eukprot:270971-Rhodomonas_salina.1